MDAQQARNAVPGICERLPDNVIHQLPSFSTAYLRCCGWRFAFMLLMGVALIVNYKAISLACILFAMFSVLLTFIFVLVRGTMRPFLRSTNQGRELSADEGVLTVADADGTQSSYRLSDCYWAEVMSLSKVSADRSLPDLACLLVYFPFKKQQTFMESQRNFMAGNYAAICGLTEDSRQSWDKILKASQAKFVGAV